MSAPRIPLDSMSPTVRASAKRTLADASRKELRAAGMDHENDRVGFFAGGYTPPLQTIHGKKKPAIRIPKKTYHKRRATVPKTLSVTAFLRLIAMEGLPAPVAELQFARPRKWRMDWAWPDAKVFLEINGGIFSNGGHVRGGYILKEWEKINTASGLGWRVLYCQPTELCARRTIEAIAKAINYKP